MKAFAIDVFDLGDRLVLDVSRQNDPGGLTSCGWAARTGASGLESAIGAAREALAEADAVDNCGRALCSAAGVERFGELATRAVGVSARRFGTGWSLFTWVPEPRRGKFVRGDATRRIAGDSSDAALAEAIADLLQLKRATRTAEIEVFRESGGAVPEPALLAEREWAAVDADGHVAIFATRVSGALPRALIGRDERIELVARDAAREEHLPAGPVIEFLDERTEPVLVTEGMRAGVEDRVTKWQLRGDRPVPCHLVFRSRVPEPLSDAGRPAAATRGVGLACDALTRQQAQLAFEDPDILAVARRTPHEAKKYLAWAASGYFVYEHLCDPWATGPYACVVRPREPIEIRRLADDIGQRARRVVFESARFRDTLLIQPADYLGCDTPFEPLSDVARQRLG